MMKKNRERKKIKGYGKKRDYISNKMEEKGKKEGDEWGKADNTKEIEAEKKKGGESDVRRDRRERVEENKMIK